MEWGTGSISSKDPAAARARGICITVTIEMDDSGRLESVEQGYHTICQKGGAT